jgi:amino acid transporter
MLFLGFDVIKPFDIKWFFIDYTLLGVFPILVVLVKVIKNTKYVRIGTADLGLGGMVKAIDDYEDAVVPQPEGWVERFFSGMWEWKGLLLFVRRKTA